MKQTPSSFRNIRVVAKLQLSKSFIDTCMFYVFYAFYAWWIYDVCACVYVCVYVSVSVSLYVYV
jgi:hypothetical protein